MDKYKDLWQMLLVVAREATVLKLDITPGNLLITMKSMEDEWEENDG